MKNITATMQYLSDSASERGESMTSIPADKLREVVQHLRALDRVVIAAEHLIEEGISRFSDGDLLAPEELDELADAVKAVAS